MTAVNRLVFNTIAQYIKTIFNVLLSFYSTRLILSALGIEDYGVYSLIGGVVAMLSFLTNALLVTTQRFLSFNQGKNNIEKLKELFGNSLLLHFFIGVATIIILEAIFPFLFHGFLNVPSTKIESAKTIYHFVTVILFLTFISAPFNALLISHENIIYISILGIFDGIIKVGFAIWLYHIISNEKLILYGIFMCIVACYYLLSYAAYAFYKYEECVIPKFRNFKLTYVKELSSFAGWTIYSSGCMVGRTQGIAILLNKFFGTAINTAYGIGFQVTGMMSFLSSSLLNAVNPQIMRAEGTGNREKMLRLAEMASKFSFFLLAIIAVPCIFEMPLLLSTWLERVPDNAILFCRMALIASMCDQLTIGLGSANGAIGNIKEYSLVVNTIKLITLPFAYIFLKFGFSIISVAINYIAFETICSIFRLFFLAKTGGLSISGFMKRVFFKEIVPLAIIVLSSFIIVNIFSLPYRFLITLSISPILYLLSIYYYGLCIDEKNIINKIFRDIMMYRMKY